MPASRIRRRLLAVLTAALAVAGIGVTAPQRAQGATLYGNDVSWPQCSTAQGGYGLPMPPSTAGFVVLGLTKGLPFTQNPCLGSQLAWARANGVPAQAYTMAAYPTNTQFRNQGTAGPWSSSTFTGKLANVGYAEARYAVATLRTAGFRPPVVWVDVEPRPSQPWLAGSDVARARNRWVVTGLLRGLDDAGYAYGLYSYASGWTAIVGRWAQPALPVWATAGRQNASAALAMCAGPSFSGGPVHLAQWYDATRDDDLTCPAFVANPPRPYPPSGPNDLDANWTTDLLARQRGTGSLYLYPGTGTGALRSAVRISGDWAAYDLIDTPGDLTNDGIPDLLTRQASTGTLWIHPRRRDRTVAPPVAAGTGWQVMDAVLGPGDVTGDGIPDVIARERATGSLWLYPRTAAGGWSARIRIGRAWQAMDAIVGAGDMTGDGWSDLLARERSTGYLWLYPGTGAGTLGPRTRIGTGWGIFDALAGPGDLNGDTLPDVVARERGTGTSWLYSRDDAGRWRPRVRLGTGWQIFNVIT